MILAIAEPTSFSLGFHGVEIYRWWAGGEEFVLISNVRTRAMRRGNRGTTDACRFGD